MKPVGSLIMLILWMLPIGVQAQSLISPFAGSEALGEYRSDFEPFQIARQKGEEIDIFEVEGRMLSNLYRKPEEKTNTELFRSYRDEIAKAGFDITLAYSKRDGNVQQLVRNLYGTKGNDLGNRRYMSGGKPALSHNEWVKTFSEFYISARKTHGDKTAYVAVLICQKRGLYAVDVLITDAMEQGTVTLSMAMLEEKIANDGKMAIYDIHFATGGEEIRPDSQPALKVIADYIQAKPGSHFYLVGHTDDTGDLQTNLALSQRRAAAVAQALARQYRVDAARLATAGVGPYAPVAHNGTTPGRQLNRRVELVLKLAQ